MDKDKLASIRRLMKKAVEEALNDKTAYGKDKQYTEGELVEADDAYDDVSAPDAYASPEGLGFNKEGNTDEDVGLDEDDYAELSRLKMKRKRASR